MTTQHFVSSGQESSPPLTPLPVQAVSSARVADVEEAMEAMAAENKVRCPATVFPTVSIHIDDM